MPKLPVNVIMRLASSATASLVRPYSGGCAPQSTKIINSGKLIN